MTEYTIHLEALDNEDATVYEKEIEINNSNLSSAKKQALISLRKYRQEMKDKKYKYLIYTVTLILIDDNYDTIYEKELKVRRNN